MRNCKRDPRSIWFRARPTAVDTQTIAKAISTVSSEIYDEMDSLESDLRSIIPDDSTTLQNDVEALERRVSDIEYERDN